MYRLISFFLILTIVVGCSKDPIDLPSSPAEVKSSFLYPLYSGINNTTSYSNSNFDPFNDYLLFNDTPEKWFSSFVTKVDLDGDTLEDYIILQSYHLDTEKGTIIIMKNGKVVQRKLSPQVFTRKVTSADLDNDGDLDIVLFGAGYDGNPWPGDEVHALYFEGEDFSIERLAEGKGYFHSGTLGDINNDGLIDIIGIDSVNGYSFILFNNGGRVFTKETLFNSIYVRHTVTSELYDINGDGYLDLFLGGHDWQNPSRFILGNGSNFNLEDAIELPSIPEYGVITDFDFIDFDNNGTEEIIISSTGDGSGSRGFYEGFKVSIIDYFSLQVTETVNGPSDFNAWGWNTVLLDVNDDGSMDIAPYYPYLNNKSWLGGEDPILNFSGLYFEHQNNFNFTTKYFKK